MLKNQNNSMPISVNERHGVNDFALQDTVIAAFCGRGATRGAGIFSC
jgi:hypothetical protein